MSNLQRYNGMDTIATFQLWDVLEPQLDKDNFTRGTYDQAMDLQAPALYAMLRGILVDQEVAGQLREKFTTENTDLVTKLDLISRGLGAGVINLASPVQVKWFLEFVGATLPTKRVKGEVVISADREALETIAKSDPELAPVCHLILAWRDRDKMLKVLNEDLVDADGRMRTFYKVGGTDTGRWSSSKNALWTGQNMQNIKRDEDEEAVGHASIRSMFIADPGMKFLNCDLKGADSWAVALEVYRTTGDRSYLNACKSRDLHTAVCMMTWPELEWQGTPDNITDADVAIAEGFFYRQYDYRFMAKKMGHGSNYYGKARTLAIQMKIPINLAEEGQERYFNAFPGIRKWHAIRARELQTTGTLVNLLDRQRRFHGRLDTDATLREAIAYLGQSVTAEVTNRGILRLWEMQQSQGGFEFLAQVHDSTLTQFYEQLNEAAFVEAVRDCMAVPITVEGPDGWTITERIPVDSESGWNWAKQGYSKKQGRVVSNFDGLKKIKPGQTDDRKRTRVPETKKVGQLGRRVSRFY